MVVRGSSEIPTPWVLTRCSATELSNGVEEHAGFEPASSLWKSEALGHWANAPLLVVRSPGELLPVNERRDAASLCGPCRARTDNPHLARVALYQLS